MTDATLYSISATVSTVGSAKYGRKLGGAYF